MSTSQLRGQVSTLAGQQLIGKLKTQQFYWFAGHVIAIASFLVFQLGFFFGPRTALKYYRVTLLSLIGTYLIVIFKRHSIPKLRLIVNQFLRDENICYFALAVSLWLFSFKLGPTAGSLYSFVIFSFFHVLTYINANLIGLVVSNVQEQRLISARITQFSSLYYDMALLMAANAEIILTAMSVVQVPLVIVIRLLFHGDVFGVLVNVVFALVMITFLKLRYDCNVHTQAILHAFDGRIEQFLFQANIPMLSTIYKTQFKGKFLKAVGMIKLPKTQGKDT